MDPLPAARRGWRRPRVPWVAPLVVLGVLAAVLATHAPAVRPVAHSAASKPFCLVDSHIPDEAYAVEEFARTHNLSPPPGLKGGSRFQDIRHSLPALLRPYTEYDVSPRLRTGADRHREWSCPAACPTRAGTHPTTTRRSC